jgi:rubrerythrin
MREAKSEALEHKVERTERSDQKRALGMELDAIEIYEKLISETKGERERKIFEEILGDEKDHERKLKTIIREE